MSSFCLVLLVLLLSTATAIKAVYDVPNYQCGDTNAGWRIPEQPPNVGSLKQVIAVIRHGDRTPYNGSKCWPDDDDVWTCYMVHGQIPVNKKEDESFKEVHRIFDKVFLPTQEVLNGNCSVGQLTSIGYLQHLANGHSLYSSYVKNGFLRQSLDPSEIYIRSSNVPRTILSAQTIIQGMFPPLLYKNISKDDCTDCIQHVTLHTRDVMYDTIEANPRLCPKYEQYSEQFFTNDKWLDHEKTVTNKVISTINEALGYEALGTYKDINRFCDCLITHYCHNLSWPVGMTEELFEMVWDETTWQYYNTFAYPSVQENAKVGIGFLLKDILQNLNDDESTEKFHLYSGHDTTLMQLLVALQLNEENIWPPFASMLLIEQYSDTANGTNTIRVMYNGDVKKIPYCNNQELCDYETFKKYLLTVISPDNFEEYCKV